jgi:hypothetical protein
VSAWTPPERFWCVKASGLTFHLDEQEGERLVLALSRRVSADTPTEPEFGEYEDVLGSRFVVRLSCVGGMWFVCPQAREHEAEWNAFVAAMDREAKPRQWDAE